jgi:hypothetical protein
LHSQVVSADAALAASPDTMNAAAPTTATSNVRHPTARLECRLFP